MLDLYQALSKRILNVDSSVREEFKKLYIAFKSSTNFVDIVPQKSRLRLSLNIAFEYRKAGIILSGLVPNENLTKRMFDDERFQQQHKLMKAIDEINQKFSKDTVKFGSVKIGGNWKMKKLAKVRVTQLIGMNYY